MLTLADVIFPAFFAPYVVQLMVPIAAMGGLAAEAYCYWKWFGGQPFARLVVVVLVANVASSLLGMLIAAQLPTGYNPSFAARAQGQWRAPVWMDLLPLAWVLAFVVSVVVEWLVVLCFRRFLIIRRTWFAVLCANAASYLVLFAVLLLAHT